MMILGVIVTWIFGIVLVVTPSPSPLLPISFFGGLFGIGLTIWGAVT